MNQSKGMGESQLTTGSSMLLGQLTSTIDAHGTGSAVTTAYTHSLRGDLETVPVGTTGNMVTVVTMQYDLAGNRTQIVEPNTGTTQFAFNALGSRSRPGFTETYNFESQYGRLTSIETSNLSGAVWASSYTRDFTYHAAGRLATQTYPGTTATPKSIQDLETVWRSNSTLYRRIDKRNTVTTADDYVDTFSYDVLERVTQQATTVGASRTLSFAYSATGNLTSKTSNVAGDLNVTGYTYSGPHRLTSVSIGGISNSLSYDNNGNITQYAAASGPNTWIDYDARNNVTQIHVGPNQSTIVARDQFWYDTDDQRVQSLESWDDSGTTRTRRVLYLGGDYEYVLAQATATHDRIIRLHVTATVRAIARRRASDQVWEDWFYEYAHRDHLGSVDAITNSAGAVQQKVSFDPFGTATIKVRTRIQIVALHIKSVSQLDQPGEPQAATLVHSLTDLEKSFRETLETQLPRLLDESLAPDQLNDLLLDIGEELRHVLYHIRAPKFFDYLIDHVAGEAGSQR